MNFQLLALLILAFHSKCLASAEISTSTNDMASMIQETHPLWLRERCLEDFHVDSETRQPKKNLHQEQEDISIAKVDATEQDGVPGFQVKFSDEQTCFFETNKILAEIQNEKTFLQTDDWQFPQAIYWDSSIIAPSTFEHDDVVTESHDQRKFLSTLISTGIAIVKHVPRIEGECARFGSQFSSVRETEWGRNFNVRSTPDTDNGSKRKDLAYTNQAIGLHVDSTYRMDSPPSFQLLHAMEHCSGPDCFVHNIFVDGTRVAGDLCRSNRECFNILTSTPLRWENNGGDNSSMLYRYAPMIELEGGTAGAPSPECPIVSAISFSAKSGGYTPNLPKEQLDTFYKAKRLFSRLLHSDKYTIRLQMNPGDLVIFDNRRVLHGRSEIAVSDGVRWLQGCYLNRDGIHYNYEKLRRKFANMTETPFRNLRQATKDDFDRMGVEYDAAVQKKTLDNLVDILKSQKASFLGAPVSLMEHNIQTASRALRAGEDDETVFISLFHDLFETLAVKNHGELVASMLAPWISPRSQWVLAHHEIFQGYYYFDMYGLDKNRRDMFLDHPFYNWTIDWCEKYDQASFDPDYPSLDLKVFIPIAERILSRTQYWWNPAHPKAGAVSASEVEVDGEMARPAAGMTNAAVVAKAECNDTWTCYTLGEVMTNWKA